MMPRNLIIVRHGESEGNLANRRSRRGNHSDFSKKFQDRPGALWRLTNLGRKQAKAAGKWIRENFREGFGRAYTSEYVRAMETAAYLDVNVRRWYLEFFLREQDWGTLDVMRDDERNLYYRHEMRWRELNPFFWAPPGGESTANVALRVDRVFNTLHRECSHMNVILVCHGNVMWALRARLERMSQVRYRELHDSKKEKDKIHNCQILHYTRCNPFNTRFMDEKHLGWMRSVCPWDTKLSYNKWIPIERPMYSAKDLLQMAERVPQLVAK